MCSYVNKLDFKNPGIALNDETYPRFADKSLFFYFGGNGFVINRTVFNRNKPFNGRFCGFNLQGPFRWRD